MALDRFITAQAAANGGYATALGEIRRGRKTTHWIWHILPQLAGLGRSPTADFYGLRDPREAEDYLHDPILGMRLREIVAAVCQQIAVGARLETLMGGRTDLLKLVSCVTLFRATASRLARKTAAEAGAWRAFIADCEAILEQANREGYPACAFTLARVASAPDDGDGCAIE
jgi:uncharacterized protein (DUF1810 family)